MANTGFRRRQMVSELDMAAGDGAHFNPEDQHPLKPELA